MIPENSITLRHLTLEDCAELRPVMEKAYANSGLDIWSRGTLQKLLTSFPEGQLVILLNDEPVAAAFSLIIQYDDFGDSHTYNEVTNNLELDTHNPNGDTLYGIEIFVHPEHRGMRLGRRLYDARKELCENLNLRAIMMGGRIPNYREHRNDLTPKQYIEKVRLQEIFDPVLTFQLSNGFSPKKILENYLPGDKESGEYAILLEWNNVYYEHKPKLINRKKSTVRLGVVQWQMRRVKGISDVIEQMEFFIDGVSAYNADFAIFPEFFNAPLMAAYNEQATPEAIRSLAQYTNPLVEKFHEFSVSYNVNIVTGSMPSIRNGKLYNTSFLCLRDGSIESQDKIHITPSEVESWGISGGEEIKVFQTDAGKVSIQICYDVEFPELGRLAADQGAEIFLVPFLTDTQNGYQRVRRCAQARAIENECFVAIAGCVGNLPKVHNMDINYAQSAVFSPSDFPFPVDAIVSEATPNTEMTVIADVNLDLLRELHAEGSVTNLKDRRKDLYELRLRAT